MNMSIFTELGPMGLSIVLILLLLSIVSWAIIIEKIILLWRADRESRRFLYIFELYSDWRDIDQETKSYRYSPFVKIFQRAIALTAPTTFSKAITERARADFGAREASQSQAIDTRPLLESAISAEILAFEKRLIFLSSTVSASPFLGLFGTVWGVMRAFMNISARGSAALTVIGPGIAEALVTTVVGLAVAIPVLFAYNMIVDKIRKYEAFLENFYPVLMKKLNSEK